MTRFTAMTWNVENLFSPGYPISPTRNVTEQEYDAKLDYLTRVIQTVKPDVVALQEIGSRSVEDRQSLDDLGDRLAELLPHRAVSNHPDRRPSGGGIRVGFLSRLPILSTEDVVTYVPGELASVPDWLDEPPRPPIQRLSRGALRIDVETEGGTRVRLVTAHLKSKLVTYLAGPRGGTRFDTDDEDERARGVGLGVLRRTAESVALRTYVNRSMQSEERGHLIVLGDLNDEPRAATTQLLLGPEDLDVTRVDKRDPIRLYNLLDSIPLEGNTWHEFLTEDQRKDRARWGTRVFNGRGEVIDHILVSRSLLGTAEENDQGRWTVQEVRIMTESIRAESVGIDPAERVGRARPDHAPVYAAFDL